MDTGNYIHEESEELYRQQRRLERIKKNIDDNLSSDLSAAISFLKRLHPVSDSLEAELRNALRYMQKRKMNSCFLKVRYATMPGTCKRVW
jgi:hypothetical protein